MRSIIVTKTGGPEVLELRDTPIPDIDDDLVLVRVKAAGINYADIMQRMGVYPNGPQPPFPAGFEIAGVVEKVGANVHNWQVGDAVMGLCSGGYSDFVVADPRGLMRKPESVDFIHAAGIPCQCLTAYHVLLTLGRLTSGQTVLIQAAAGGLGTVLVQIARNSGATVIGTCGTDQKIDLLRQLNCDHPVNYRTQDFEEEVRRITGGCGCDLVVESVGGEIFEKSLRCIKTRGHMIVVGAASGVPGGVCVLGNCITVSGFNLMVYLTDAPAMAIAYRDLLQWLTEGALKIVVNHVLPLERAAEAQQLIAERKTTGKVVLSVED